MLARVEQRDEAPKLLVEHAVRFDDAGIAEIRRVADERRQSLAKRAKFMRPTNGNGHGASTGGSGVLPAVGGSPRPAYSPAPSKGTPSAVTAGSTAVLGESAPAVTLLAAVIRLRHFVGSPT